MSMTNLENIKKYASENKVPIMQDGGLEFLCSLIKKREVTSILECGTAIGYSSIQMAKVSEGITIDTCEIKPHLVKIAKENIENEGFSHRIHVIECDAVLFQTSKKYDLIFVDAAKAQYKKYMDHFRGNISEQGIFVFDNLCFHGMVDDPTLVKNRNTKQLIKKIKKFREYILESEEFETEYLPAIGDGVAIVKIKKLV